LGFPLNQFIFNGLFAGSVYALVAIGFAIIYQPTRFFHFAHGAIYTLGVYFAYLFSVQLGLDQFIAFLLAAISAAAFGAVCEILVYNPMCKNRATDLTLLIASLGLYFVLQNAISMIWGDDTKTMRTAKVAVGHEVLGSRITDVQIVIVSTSVVLVALLALGFTKTTFGKTLRALANDPELARLCGIESDRFRVYAFAIGSFLAAVAAIMISFDTDITPTMGFNALAKGVIAVVIGGMGSLPGAALGGLLLGLSENIGVYWLPSKWQDTIAFVILILFLVFRPYGILGKKPQKAIL
jgi:branched-chain amino acid transport system permease protein